MITELNDVQWELNGLMDVTNRRRRFAQRLAGLQQPWLIVARARRTTISVGESVQVAVRLAGADETPKGCKLAWRFADQTGQISVGAEPATIKLNGPPADAIAIHNLDLEASDGAGRLLSRNSLEFCVVPRLKGPAASLYAMDGPAHDILAALDWPNRAASPDEADVLLAIWLTTPLRERLIAGRKALLIANSPDALIDPERHLPLSDRHNFPKMSSSAVRERHGTGNGWGRSHGGARMARGPACPMVRCSTNIGRAFCPITCPLYFSDGIRRAHRFRRCRRLAA